MQLLTFVLPGLSKETTASRVDEPNPVLAGSCEQFGHRFRGCRYPVSITMDALAARFAPMNISDDSQHSCDRLCCSPMIHYQEMPSSKIPDLSNAIHPVFRPGNFYSTIDYSVIAPALRLATHFLLSNSAVVYINSVFDGVIRDPSGAVCMMPTYQEMENRGGFWSIWPRLGMDGLTHETKQRAMQILYHMADMITVGLCDP
jgi:hypothetical protein